MAWLNTYLPKEAVYEFLLCAFCSTYYAVCISTHAFFCFYSSDSLPHPTKGKRERLGCWLGLNHERKRLLKKAALQIQGIREDS